MNFQVSNYDSTIASIAIISLNVLRGLLTLSFKTQTA